MGTPVNPYGQYGQDTGTHLWTVPESAGDPAYPAPPLWAVKKRPGGSTQVHIQTFDGWGENDPNGGWSFAHQKGTQLGETGSNWEFALGQMGGSSWPEVWAVKKSGGPTYPQETSPCYPNTKCTEVHVMQMNHNGPGPADDSWTFNFQAPTTIHETGSNWDFSAGEFRDGGFHEVWGFRKWGGSQPEVHIEQRQGNSWVRIHSKTLPVNINTYREYFAADWDGDSKAEIWIVNKFGTTLQILKHNPVADNWYTVFGETQTLLGATDTQEWRFTASDWNHDDKVDLWGIKKNYAGPKTEVHVQSYSPGGWSWFHRKPTALHKTGSNFEFGTTSAGGSAADSAHNCEGFNSLGFLTATDDDCDGVPDTPETPCGSGTDGLFRPDRRPERVDLAGDDDGDTLVDEALPGGVSAYDCDGDGYSGAVENHVYSYIGQTNGDQKACGEYDLSFPNPSADIRPSLRWPSDINKSDGVLDSFNRITVLDVTSFLAPVDYLDTNVGTNPSDVRFDLVPGPGIFSTDINVNDLTALIAGSSGYPPMLGGAEAYDGPPCPWPP